MSSFPPPIVHILSQKFFETDIRQIWVCLRTVIDF